MDFYKLYGLINQLLREFCCAADRFHQREPLIVLGHLKHSIKSEGVINLFSDVQTKFSLFDPKFLEEVANMKEKNLAVELLKKLISEQVSVYRRTNIVKSEKFSEIIQSAIA